LPRRSSAFVPLLLLLLAPLAAEAMELGPPARGLATFRENDAGYMSLGFSSERIDMKEYDHYAYSPSGVQEVERQVTYASFAWLPHDRVEMDLRLGIQGMKVGNAIEVDGRVLDGDSRMSGFAGGGVRVLAYENPDAGFRLGWLVDGSVTVLRWKKQKDRFQDADDNAVVADLWYGEYMEARMALPLAKVFRLSPRVEMDTLGPRGVPPRGAVDWPFPKFTALEIYGGPFVRAAFMYGDASATVGSQDLGHSRFYLFQDTVAGAFAGMRAYAGEAQRWSIGLEGRYQSELSVSFLVDTSL
jgi:hypothetical protein